MLWDLGNVGAPDFIRPLDRWGVNTPLTKSVFFGQPEFMRLQ